MKLSVSQNFYNKENKAEARVNRKTGQLSNLWAMGAFTTVDWTPDEIADHLKAGKAICVGAVEDGWRSESNFISSQIMGIDFDNGPDVPGLITNDFVRQYAFYIYPTPSHTPDKPRSRALFALDEPITDAKRYRTLITRLMAHFGQIKADPSCKDPVRLFYGSDVGKPGRSAGKVLPLAVLESLPKTPEEIAREQAAERPAVTFDATNDKDAKRAQAYSAAARQRIIDNALANNVEGYRHHAFIAAVWQLVAMEKGGWPGFDADRDARFLGTSLEREAPEIESALAGARRKVDADWFQLPDDTPAPALTGTTPQVTPAGAVIPTGKPSMTAAELLEQSDARKVLIVSGKARLWLPTGYKEWDAQLGGGMWMGSNYIAGGPKMGKSTLCNSLMGKWAAQGLRGFVVTTEMAADMWLDRTLAAMARVPAVEVMLGNISPGGNMVYLEARRKVVDTAPVFCTRPVPSVADIREEILDLAASKRIDYVIIDSASNMHAPGVSGDLFSQMKAITNQINTLALEAHKARGGTEPMPFVVTAQGNINQVRHRETKIITALDIYGGQTAGQDASTMTTVNWFHWYVMKHLTDPNPEWPENVAALNVEPPRYGAGGNGKLIRMRFVPGMGFYDDNVPAGQKPEPTRSKVVNPPRQYKDNDDLEPIMDVPF